MKRSILEQSPFFFTILKKKEIGQIMMKAVKERHEYDPLFPLVYLPKLTGNPGEKVPFYHFHNWYELVFVHDGKGSFLVDKHFFDMEKNDLYLIPGDVIHKASADKTAPYTCSVILFHPMLIQIAEVGDSFSYLGPFHDLIRSGRFKLRLSAERMKEFEKLLGMMDDEYCSAEKGNRSAVILLLHWMLLQISRMNTHFEHAKKGHMPDKRDWWMKDVLNYIDSHYTDSHLSLTVLADQALVSPAHFSRTFKKTTGFTLPAFLEMKRLVKAKELLLTSDHSVSFISDLCGYKSLSHFHKRFKQQLGKSPGEFRRMN